MLEPASQISSSWPIITAPDAVDTGDSSTPQKRLIFLSPNRVGHGMIEKANLEAH